jgi:hypothetical protein
MKSNNMDNETMSTTSTDNLEKRKDTMRQYVSDMLAVEKHIHAAVSLQNVDESVTQQPQASQLINRIEQTLDDHIIGLESHIKSLEGTASGLKEAVTTVLGRVAGLYDKLRPKEVSRMLRDDYTAMSMAAIGYTMLNTSALALSDNRTANLAVQYLKDWTPLITGISRIIPQVVTNELTKDHPNLATSAASESLNRTQEAWSTKHVNQVIKHQTV